MKFDFAKTISLVKGGLRHHQSTWNTYFEDCPGWQQTAIQLTGPLLLASSVLSVIFARLIGGFSQYALYGNFFTALVASILMGVISVLIASLVFGMMAKVFNGKNDFSRAFAAISFAMIPAWVATIVGSIVPWIGWLFMLAGFVMTMVFLYKIMPLALNVPDGKRVVHYISSIVIVIIINMIIGAIIGPSTAVRQAQMNDYISSSTSGRTSAVPGFVNEIERQGQLMESAQSDVFEPPSDGEVSEAQVKEFIKVLQKTRAAQEDYTAKMQKLGEDMDAKNKAGEAPSVADLTSMFKGVGGAVSAANVEMEVVKTGGGNWAEHQWVKEQLRIARIQQGDGSDAIKHNYELYKEYEDELNI